MFTMCLNIERLDLSSWDTSNVTDMSALFYNYNNKVSKYVDINLDGWDTSNVTSMATMFYGCGNLTSLNLSSFNTSNVTNMRSMFYGCTSLEELDVSNFDVSKLTTANLISTMGGMFDGLTCKIKINSQWTEEMKKESGYQER